MSSRSLTVIAVVLLLGWSFYLATTRSSTSGFDTPVAMTQIREKKRQRQSAQIDDRSSGSGFDLKSGNSTSDSARSSAVPDGLHRSTCSTLQARTPREHRGEPGAACSGPC